MAKSRDELHEFLCGILGSRNAYFRPPESVKMEYPAIRYDLSKVNKRSANNTTYITSPAYEITLIDYDPESEIFQRILSIPLCSFDRPYTVDGLNHWVFTLYY